MGIPQRSPAPLAWSQAPGLYQERKARQTGHYVGIYDASYLGLPADGKRYVTVCEEHGASVRHMTLVTAKRWATRPLAWCAACLAEKEEKR